jgi:hypothetical protein
MKYTTIIEQLVHKQKYTREDLLKSDFLIGEENNLQIYYAPFEVINKNAKVIFVGITPGWQQMEIAFRIVKNEMINGASWGNAIMSAKMSASFAGPLRKNLVNYLDAIELNKKLNLDSTSELFENQNSHLLHSTSMLRNPVLLKGKNYRGKDPAPYKSSLLWGVILNNFVEEINHFKGKLIIPLGVSVKDVIKQLQAENLLKDNLILENFPHPSGLNGHRHIQFKTFKDSMTAQIRDWKM